jgi:CelD/BcsL family acetyltransferase involved in cellulose biosynthesis
MELDQRPVAIWYGFRFAGVEWYYQAGWDPAFAAGSVGFVLLAHTIRAALNDGAGAYWFLRGGEEYKARFAEEDAGIETLLVPRGVRGRLAARGATSLDRVPRVAKEWAKKLAG